MVEKGVARWMAVS